MSRGDQKCGFAQKVTCCSLNISDSHSPAAAHSRHSRNSQLKTWFLLRIISINDVAELSKDGPFFTAAASQARSSGHNAAGKPAKRQGLKPNTAGTAKGSEEQAFTAEQRRLDFADELNVVVHRRLESDNAAGIDTQQFARRKCFFGQHAAGMNKGPAISLQPLHDESFAAEQPHAQAPLESDSDADALGGGQK